jgi:hypothetical protein
MIISNELNSSLHASKRMSLRGISNDLISICIEHGHKVYRTGIVFYILLGKTVKKLNLPQALEGLCVLVSHDNTIITTYKNRKAISNVKKLDKFNLKRKKKSFNL